MDPICKMVGYKHQTRVHLRNRYVSKLSHSLPFVISCFELLLFPFFAKDGMSVSEKCGGLEQKLVIPERQQLHLQLQFFFAPSLLHFTSKCALPYY